MLFPVPTNYNKIFIWIKFEQFFKIIKICPEKMGDFLKLHDGESMTYEEYRQTLMDHAENYRPQHRDLHGFGEGGAGQEGEERGLGALGDVKGKGKGKGGKGKGSFEGTCYRCGRYGHSQRFCAGSAE